MAARSPALAVLAVALLAAGCGGRDAAGRVAADVPATGLAPSTAWYVARTYDEPLSGDAPETGGRWQARLPVRAETWAEPGGERVTARIVVAGRARFPTEADRLAYLASSSDDADLPAGTVLQDGVTSGGSAGVQVLGLAAAVGALPPRPTRAAERALTSFAVHQQTVRPSPRQQLTGLADVLAVAPVPAAYRRSLVAAAGDLPGVRAWRDGDGLVVRARGLRLVVDARTGALRTADGFDPPLGRVEATAVVRSVGLRP